MELAVEALTRSTYHRARARLLGCALLAFALCAAPASAASAPSTASQETLIIEGAGDGHGVGMSQYGAMELAEHGYSDTQIITHYYTGVAIGAAPANHIIRVLVGSKVQDVPLEQYVRGVVAAEMPSSWPAAALEAQAIASRTYALTTDAGGSRFDVYSDTRSQVYRGAAAETPTSNAAVAATAGQIVTYDGAPVTTYFFASSGGMTENIENSFIGAAPQPWLKGVSDPYETSAAQWRVSISMASATNDLKGLVKGSLLGIEVLKRGVSPRIVSALVLGSGGNTIVSGPELEWRFGLASAWAYFSLQNGTSITREPDESGQSPRGVPKTPAAPTSTQHAPSSAPANSARAKPVPKSVVVMDAERGGVEGPAGRQPQQVGRTGGVQAG